MMEIVKSFKKTIIEVIKTIDFNIQTDSNNKKINIGVKNESANGNIDINMDNDKPEIKFSFKRKNVES